MSEVYLLLGANLGDRLAQMSNAFQEIKAQVGEIVRYSALYQTEAWGREGGPPYLNQVLCVETQLLPFELLTVINEIENKLGRTRMAKWESRLIDIDILFYGEELINDINLVIPHPYIQKRKFTLVPLAEIAPLLVHPVLKKAIRELLIELDDPLEVQKIN